MAKEKLTFAVDTSKPAPAPKRKIEENKDLAAALKALPKGASLVIPTAQIETSVARVHVQRAQKDAAEGERFVTRNDEDAKGLRVWKV